MRALLTSILVVFTIVQSAFLSPLAAEAAAFDKTTFSKIQKRKLFIFGCFASLKCNFAKSIISESDAEALLKKEIPKDENADVVLDFLNDKRVNELNNFFAKYLYENSEDCNVSEEVIEDNVEIFLELMEFLVEEEQKPRPSGRNWLSQ